MKTLYHGTTLANYKNILENGFGGDSVTWHCSDMDATYFYDASKDDDEYSLISSAFSNAKISAAIQGYNAESLVVIKVEIEDEFVYDDDSCRNMEDVASYVYNKDLNKENIVQVFIADEGYCPALKLFYIAGVINNEFINLNNLSNLEEQICRKISEKEIWVDELYEIDWVVLTETNCLV